MQLSKRKFDHKVLEKVSQECVHRKVDLSNIVTQLDFFLKAIHTLYMKLCDVEFFTLENQ